MTGSTKTVKTAKRGRGRPAMEDRGELRERRVPASFSPAEHALVLGVAERERLPVAVWLRKIALDAAELAEKQFQEKEKQEGKE